MPAAGALRTLANPGASKYSERLMIITNFAAVTRRAFAGLIALCLIASCAPSSAPQALPNYRGETTVYVVRHAEKAPPVSGNSDVDLSASGYARADSLAGQLREAGIDVVITTQLKRTQLTARALAAMRGITPVVVPATSPVTAHAESVAVAVRRYPGSRILVVGHSNTVGPIITALGGGPVGDLCDSEYSNLFTLTLSPSAPTRLHAGSFGARDAVPEAGCVPVRARQ